MALHDPDLIKAFDNNRADVRAEFSDTAQDHYASLTVGQRKFKAEEVRIQIIRHDILAGRKCNAEFADHYRGIADNYRAQLVMLESVA